MSHPAVPHPTLPPCLQTGAAKTREPALGLMKERLMKEGITDWAAFERIYLAPAQRG